MISGKVRMGMYQQQLMDHYKFPRNKGTISHADFNIAKATISGTTLTYDSTITCGDTEGYFDSLTADDTYIYSMDVASPYFRKWNMSGVLQATSSGVLLSNDGIININNTICYLDDEDGQYIIMKLPL